MFGGELLVAFSQGQRLRRLHEALGAVGVFFEIHIVPLLARSPAQVARVERQNVRMVRRIAGPFRHPATPSAATDIGLPERPERGSLGESSHAWPFRALNCLKPMTKGQMMMGAVESGPRVVGLYRYAVKGLSPEQLN